MGRGQFQLEDQEKLREKGTAELQSEAGGPCRDTGSRAGAFQNEGPTRASTWAADSAQRWAWQVVWSEGIVRGDLGVCVITLLSEAQSPRTGGLSEGRFYLMVLEAAGPRLGSC